MGKKARKNSSKASLSDFLKLNPLSTVEKDQDKLIVKNPWNDPSLSFVFEKDDKSLIGLLNSVILPPSFSAIYHVDDKALEFIFTIFIRGDDYKDRKFQFEIGESSYTCEFAPPSKRLLSLARVFKREDARTSTDYRGISEFAFYVNKSKGMSGLTPRSFWVRGIEWDSVKAIEIAKHINFYTQYFDADSPTILIHEETSEPENREVRYLFDTFPSHISAHRIDSYLLGLWKAATDAEDIFLEFLYYYQIVEYAAYYYLNEDIAQKINRILLQPHTDLYLKKASSEIIELLSDKQQNDPAKFDSVVKQYVDLDVIWRAISPVKELYTKETTFTGGFVIKPLVTENTSVDEFKVFGYQQTSQRMREIRNAVAHARDTKTRSVIAPTQENSDKIYHWTKLMRVIAAQIMIGRL